MITRRKTDFNLRQSALHLSNELVAIILYYFSDRFPDIMRFRAVCKQWREVAQTSSLWLKMDLTFHCSDAFYKAMHEGGGGAVHRRRESVVSVYSEAATSLVPHDCVTVTVLASPCQGPPPFDLTHPTPLEAQRVCKAFIAILLSYQEVWQWHARHRPTCVRLASMVSGFLYRGYLLFSFTVGILCQLTSVRYLTTSSTVALTWQPFLCMYIYGAVYLFLCVLGGVHALSSLVLSQRNLKRRLRFADVCPWLSAASLIMGLIAAIALLQYKLYLDTSTSSSSFLYTYTIAPVWTSYFVVILLFMRCVALRQAVEVPATIGLIVTCLVAFSLPYSLCLGLTLYYDGLVTYPLAYAMTPLYVILLLALVAVAVSTLHYFIILRDVWEGKSFLYWAFYPHLPFLPDAVVIVSMETLRVASFWGMLLLCIFVVARLTSEGVGVVEGLLCSIAWSLCFCVLLYIFGFTTNHSSQ